MVVLQGKVGKVYTFPADSMVNEVRQKVKDTQCKFVVVDGMTHEEKDRYLKNIVWTDKVVYVTSQSLHVPMTIQSALFFEMPSWCLEEYKSACQNSDFFDTIRHNLCNCKEKCGCKMDEVMTNKFFLAGVCAQWFFGTTVKVVKKEIKNHLERVDSTKYVKLLKGNKQSSVVNHLLGSTKDGDLILVSEFVVRSLSLNCELSIIKGFLQYKAVQKNPAFQGWVVELKFMADLRVAENRKGQITVKDGDGTNENWGVLKYTMFNKPEEIQLQEKPHDEWFIPNNWNQGGYDCVEITTHIDGVVLRIVQVTRGKSHSYKLEYVVQLMTKLKENNKIQFVYLDIVMVHPSGTVVPRIDDITGFRQLVLNCKDYKTKRNWKTDDIRKLNFECPNV